MDWAEPANVWCNCQRDLIISTLHVGLLCSVISSSLSGSLEPAWIRGSKFSKKSLVMHLLFSHLSENFEQQWPVLLANFTGKSIIDYYFSCIISPLHESHSSVTQEFLFFIFFWKILCIEDTNLLNASHSGMRPTKKNNCQAYFHFCRNKPSKL